MKNGKFIKISKQIIAIKKLLFILVLLILAVGCTQSQNKEQTKEYINEVERLLGEWDDANTLANNTSRGALSQPIARLQEIRRKAENLKIPEDAVKVNRLLVDYMNKIIDGYFAFMTEEKDSKIAIIFDEADLLLKRFMKAFVDLKIENEK